MCGSVMTCRLSIPQVMHSDSLASALFSRAEVPTRHCRTATTDISRRHQEVSSEVPSRLPSMDLVRSFGLMIFRLGEYCRSVHSPPRVARAYIFGTRVSGSLPHLRLTVLLASEQPVAACATDSARFMGMIRLSTWCVCVCQAVHIHVSTVEGDSTQSLIKKEKPQAGLNYKLKQIQHVGAYGQVSSWIHILVLGPVVSFHLASRCSAGRHMSP